MFTDTTVPAGESETWTIVNDSRLTITSVYSDTEGTQTTEVATFSYTYDSSGLVMNVVSVTSNGTNVTLSEVENKMVFAYSVAVSPRSLRLTPRLSKTTAPDILYEAAGSFENDDGSTVYESCVLTLTYDDESDESSSTEVTEGFNVTDIDTKSFTAEDVSKSSHIFNYTVSNGGTTITISANESISHFTGSDRLNFKASDIVLQAK